MSGSFYVVTYKGEQDPHVRVMGFKCDENGAKILVAILGDGAEYEEIPGHYPPDERECALAYELQKKRHGLRLVGGV
jgi:hypothetical protein